MQPPSQVITSIKVVFLIILSSDFNVAKAFLSRPLKSFSSALTPFSAAAVITAAATPPAMANLRPVELAA
jgi:hypothetical protein